MNVRNYSKQREAIYEKICSTKSHPTAEWVYKELREELPKLSLATVYRNIALFKEDGVVKSAGIVDGQERIDGNTEPHTHFICKSCNAVIDMPFSPLIVDQVCVSEHLVDHVEVTIYGTCEKCLPAQTSR